MKIHLGFFITGCLSSVYAVAESTNKDGSSVRLQCSLAASRVLPGPDPKLKKLRIEMESRNSILGAELDAYIVPSCDEHQSETTSKRDMRLKYISGFSGTDGMAAITLKEAALWTDGRYRLQADGELPCEWLIMQHEDPAAPTLPQWLGTVLRPNTRVGADPRLVPHYLWESWEQVLQVMNIKLVPVLPNNLVDIIWNADDRPPPSNVKVYLHKKEFAGKLWLTKVQDLRKELKDHGVDAMVITALDEIAWLLNVRGKDLPYTPVAKAYMVVTEDSLYLYIDVMKLSVDAKRSLKDDNCFNANCVKVHAYDNIWIDLRTMSQGWESVLLPASFSLAPGVSEAIYSHIPEGKRIYKQSPIINMKAKKNPVEIEGMRRAHIRDGAAMCGVLAYIEKTMSSGDEWNELKVVREVDFSRKSQMHNKGISFATIAGYGKHGALPHYQPTNITNIPILKDSTLVLDSGGQYDDGTTDITRTLHYGRPTAEQRKAYTLVLMASIDLSTTVFPNDVKVNDVDILARKVHWQNHVNYMHSTGHGIGSFLQAHEAPIQIAYSQRQKTTFKPGYFFSNEPGFYEEENFGVRLENVLEVVEAFEGKPDKDGNVYLAFKDVTLVPYEPKMIDLNMLTLYQRRWLNDYNARVRKYVGAELKKQLKMTAFYWMMNNTISVPEFGMINAGAPLIVSNIMILAFVFLLAGR